MKKRMAWLLLLCLAVMLTACFNKDGYGGEKMYFEARVIAVEGYEMLVGGGHVGLCHVTFPETFDLSDYERGNYVQIGHSGTIADSYPSQARGYAIRELRWDEVKAFRKEITLSGIVESVTEEELRIRSEDAIYLIRLEYLNEAPTLNAGDRISVLYDGIVDDGLGASELCFVTRIEVLSE